MSVLAKALKDEGLALDGANSLPLGQRGVRVFRRLIQATRAAEAEMIDQLSKSERELAESLRQNLILQERNRLLEEENRKFRAKEWSAGIEALTATDRASLLQAVSPEPKAAPAGPKKLTKQPSSNS